MWYFSSSAFMDVLEALDNTIVSAKGKLFIYLKTFICIVVKRQLNSFLNLLR